MIIVDTLKEVDVDLALSLMNGYEQIYCSIVNEFLNYSSNLAEEVEKKLRNNLPEARRLVHSCKGISKNIGSVTLHEVSRDLEQAIIKENHDAIGICFNKFKKVFARVLEDLRNISFTD